MKKNKLLKFTYKLVGLVYKTDERIGNRLIYYFPTYKSFIIELLNQLSRIIGISKSFGLQGILIEPTNACNLKCNHCSTQKLNDKKGFMSYDLFKKIINQNPQLMCVLLSKNGEPLLHKKIFDMIEYCNNRNIYVSIYTNGILLTREKTDKLLISGLNEIHFSMEGIKKAYEENRGVSYDTLRRNISYLLEMREKTNSDLRVGINMADIGGNNFSEIKKEWESKVDFIYKEPLMGKKSKLRTKRCRILWRNLVVSWNGIVIPCCVDFANELNMGNVNNSILNEIFNNKKMMELRKKHIKKEYPQLCKNCDLFFG